MTEGSTETDSLATGRIHVPLAQPSLMLSGQSIWSQALGHCKILKILSKTNDLVIARHEKQLGKGMDPAVLGMLAFIRDGYDAFFLAYSLQTPPTLRGTQNVDTPTPLIILRKRWGSH